jgi:hypothetical protein
MVKMVLALLKMEVREDMRAATITAIMSPRSPRGRREVYGLHAFWPHLLPSLMTLLPQAPSQLIPTVSSLRRQKLRGDAWAGSLDSQRVGAQPLNPEIIPAHSAPILSLPQMRT